MSQSSAKSDLARLIEFVDGYNGEMPSAEEVREIARRFNESPLVVECVFEGRKSRAERRSGVRAKNVPKQQWDNNRVRWLPEEDAVIREMVGAFSDYAITEKINGLEVNRARKVKRTKEAVCKRRGRFLRLFHRHFWTKGVPRMPDG